MAKTIEDVTKFCNPFTQWSEEDIPFNLKYWENREEFAANFPEDGRLVAEALNAAVAADNITGKFVTKNIYGTQQKIHEYYTYATMRFLSVSEESMYSLVWIKDLDTYICTSNRTFDIRFSITTTRYDGRWQSRYVTDDIDSGSGKFIIDEEGQAILYEKSIRTIDTDQVYHIEYARSAFYLHNEEWYVEDPSVRSDPRDSNLFASGGLDCYSTNPADIWGFKTLSSSEGTILKAKQKYADKNSKLFFGLELEYEFESGSCRDSRADAAEAFHEIDCALSADGSLSDGGEVKTPPCTFEYLMNTGIIDNICSIASNHCLESAPSAGFHVHVSREGLTVLQIAKIKAFIYNYRNKKFLVDIARRTSDRWASLDPNDRYSISSQTYPDGKQNNGSIRKFYNKNTVIGRNKYLALNLSKAETIEFRLFRSTNDPRYIRYTIQFCKALADFCNADINPMPISQVIQLDNFLDYIASTAAQFPELVNYLSTKCRVDLTSRAQKGATKCA